MKKLIGVLFVMALAGCQSHSVNRPPVATYASIHPATAHGYVSSAAMAVQSRLYDADMYRGKTCDLVIHQKDGQLPDSVTSQSGDETLCKAAVAATKQAISDGVYPYKPSDANQHLEDDLPMRFSPQ